MTEVTGLLKLRRLKRKYENTCDHYLFASIGTLLFALIMFVFLRSERDVTALSYFGTVIANLLVLVKISWIPLLVSLACLILYIREKRVLRKIDADIERIELALQREGVRIGKSRDAPQ
ncbi:MAG TPA: hypothetical protein HA257_09220 [Candidatus Methanoperedenaceae archaeon]|nr:hypothetical protein [Candidatus Methanoperedenaceae archaeon]